MLNKRERELKMSAVNYYRVDGVNCVIADNLPTIKAAYYAARSADEHSNAFITHVLGKGRHNEYVIAKFVYGDIKEIYTTEDIQDD